MASEERTAACPPRAEKLLVAVQKSLLRETGIFNARISDEAQKRYGLRKTKEIAISNYQGFAAVTQALRFLLKDKGEGTLTALDITALPPDKAKEANDGSRRLNLFLYHVTPNATFRNQPFLPSPTLENQPHPLAVTLHYLVTAYNGTDADIDPPFSEEALGDAMRVFHDFPCLSPVYIETALGASVFKEQIENVRIAWNPMTPDDMSKLWGAFQTPYRLSAAYEVSVVLIKSQKIAIAATPVLSRASDAVTSWTALESLTILASGETDDTAPARRSAIEVNTATANSGVLLLRGTGLSPLHKVRLKRPDGTNFEISAAAVTMRDDGRLRVEIPPASDNWATHPGIYGVCLLVLAPGSTTVQEETNLLPYAVAPKILVEPIVPPPVLPLTPRTFARGDTLTLTLDLPLASEQRVVCLLGSVPISPVIVSADGKTVRATIPGNLIFEGQPFPTDGTPIKGKVVRLRVDGADTQPMRRNPAKPTELEFDPDQQVEVTAS